MSPKTAKPNPDLLWESIHQTTQPYARTQLSASSLLGFTNDLPQLPSVLPDGTVLDVNATDSEWQDVDFPERKSALESRESLVESEEERAAFRARLQQNREKFQAADKSAKAIKPKEGEGSKIPPVFRRVAVRNGKVVLLTSPEAVESSEGYHAWRSGQQLDEFLPALVGGLVRSGVNAAGNVAKSAVKKAATNAAAKVASNVHDRMQQQAQNPNPQPQAESRKPNEDIAPPTNTRLLLQRRKPNAVPQKSRRRELMKEKLNSTQYP